MAQRIKHKFSQRHPSSIPNLFLAKFGSILITPLYKNLLQPSGSIARPHRATTDFDQVPSSFRTSHSPSNCKGSLKPFLKNIQFTDFRKQGVI